MSAYSIEGYLVAVRVRSARTVLVEGPDDEHFLQRLIVGAAPTDRDARTAIVIDTTQLIRAGLGAREIVAAVHRRTEGLRSRFGGFVDREFRRFQLAPAIVDELGGHHCEDGSLFWTRGHSVENYLFTADCIAGYLTAFYPRLMTSDLPDGIRAAMPEALAWAAALSVAALAASQLERSRSLLCARSWSTRPGGALQLDVDGFVASLRSRKATETALGAFRASLESTLEQCRRMPPGTLRWVAHGHIGLEVLWTITAHLAEANGASAQEVAEIATGFRAAKFRLAVDRWAEAGLLTGQNSEDEWPAGLLRWCFDTTA